ncbi:disease resistance protein RUN1-like [Rosa rugosa]|uniref:disease resistance protein RUN1-like n=1 Tax=Rosa rugosa TaxID=74645 RepID=UPI002B4046C6|nr:disease resistance protein RUN1-like [Rosa rugosa]
MVLSYCRSFLLAEANNFTPIIIPTFYYFVQSDVFPPISLRGGVKGKNRYLYALGFYIYNLYKAFDREKIKTFFDDRTLKRGENISAALLRGIEVSKIYVVICSENYASSSWCLDELVKILECQKSKQQIVILVFYKVDPAHVRHQTGSFGQALAGLKYNKDRVPIWRAALTQVANLSGWTYVDGYESDFIEKIVREILDVVGLNDQKTKEDESCCRELEKFFVFPLVF